jgi:hypothetical protein
MQLLFSDIHARKSLTNIGGLLIFRFPAIKPVRGGLEMFNLGSNQPTSSRVSFAAVDVGRSMSATGIVASCVGGALLNVSVLTMGSNGDPAM